MRTIKATGFILCATTACLLMLCSFFNDQKQQYTFRFPYKQQGLTSTQAAAHLLSRFTYGATPGQVDAVVKQGLENWFQQQLSAELPDDSLNLLLNKYTALKLSNQDIADTFPKPAQVLKMAIRDSVVNKDSVKTDRQAYKDVIASYMQQKGYKPEQELFKQFINQKVMRAAYTHNQLQEVMTDFWFNHFNVSITKNDCAQFIPNYERQVIRPHALGKFDSLLLATAQSPAMLYYLDNFSSSGVQKQGKQMQGLNENYAREVMELHTLGVDGGYTQQDVTQAARVLTGWTVYPLGTIVSGQQNFLSRFTPEQLQNRGFVHQGDFLFNANKHDNGEKTVLGRHFAANGGYQEGVDLLEMLANHPSTAQFISRKLAVRFVSDNPPKALISQMAKTFESTGGDIKQVLITMVSSREFWSKAAVREKTKSPFELAIGTVRSLNAAITQPYQLYNWINKMGEKKYYYIAPTGFPDKGLYWINTGSLLERMNFGLAFAAGRIPGVSANLPALNNNHEPESAQAALITYSKLIMPGRTLDQLTINRLTPMLTAPGLEKKVNEASAKTPADTMPPQTAMADTGKTKRVMADQAKLMAMPNNGNNNMLAQVVGVIIGSPEYQRR